MKKDRKTVVINGSKTITVIQLTAIAYFQADGNYCHIFTNDGKSIMWCKRVGDVMKELDDSEFIKISQSIILNKAYLKTIHKKTKEIELSFDTERLPSLCR